ncbi:GspE/PulE family protein [Glaciimonas immobilis]|uniref:General secretion pathway protein E n=1 Tax=Glaciimonas immobilis TaxID=728004 RepID=A0A840RTP4_9BURK|nr:GspE/PulE family protein [Glaciimonas immobilis]KAF3998301.1 type II/IV secretion system protein [Glaciimonas immobilis]MBB5201917.1 general secretion pathway protein E [Glaciimonas immobilis]
MTNNLNIDVPAWLSAYMADSGEPGISQLLNTHPEMLEKVAGMMGLVAIPAEIVLAADCDFDIMPLARVLEKQILPIRVDGVLHLVMGRPDSIPSRNWTQRLASEHAAMLAITIPDAVTQRLQLIEAQERAIDQFQQDKSERQTDDVVEISLSTISQDQSPVVKLLNSTLFDALQSRASDIHLESVDDGLVVKYRIDGVLQAITEVQGSEFAEQTISRIKVLGGMDIGERRIPQDGRFKACIQSRNIDFRVSVMPSIHGEDAVLRVLDKSSQNQAIKLETLGFDIHTLDRIRSLVKIPHGMVLVTGPTGSGKSTTLYATLSELNSGEEKLITIEDPVEYQLHGVLQIPVNDKKGLTFAKGLRSILRHDPDIILVGEIRDTETAGIAVQAALTGHLVLSSVHANGVFSVLERFLYMGVEPASLLEALNGVVAQRLVRRNCPTCSVPVAESALPPTEGLHPLHSGVTGQNANLMAGPGCDACRFTGFHGRIALAEILRCSEAFKDAVIQKVPMRELKAIAKAEGFVSMSEVAMSAVLQGKTTLQEVQRVIAME